MMVSPKAAQAEGDKFGAKPVCSGPFKFVERVAQDRIVARALSRTTGTRATIHFDKIVYLPIVDSTVRLANLRSGQLDFIERMAASDVPALKSDTRFKISQDHRDRLPGHHDQRRQERPGAEEPAGPRSARARGLRALARPRRHRAGRDGRRGRPSATSGSRRTIRSTRRTCRSPKRDVARAKALLKEAGVPNPSFTLMTPTTSDAQRVAQVVQAMAKEAGFDVKIQSTEFATSLDLADKGQFDAYVLAWSGRADPDGNIYSFDACKQPLNYAGYCKPEVDELLKRSRTTGDLAERKKLFEQIAAIVLKDRPIVYLYHRHWLWAYTEQADGLRTDPRRAGARAGPEASAEARAALPPAWRRRAGGACRRHAVHRLSDADVPRPPRSRRSSRRSSSSSMLIFGLQQLLPGDPAMILAGEERDPDGHRLSARDAAPRRAAAGALPLLGARRAARRPRRIAAHPAAGAAADPREAAGHARARVLRDRRSRSRSAYPPASCRRSSAAPPGTTPPTSSRCGACRRPISGSASC